MSILVVTIHTTPMELGLRPIFRLAVPLFLSSHYICSFRNKVMFYWKRMNLKVLRNLLGVIWNCIFWGGHYFVAYNNSCKEMVYWLWNVNLCCKMFFLFSSTFGASWFLMASLIGIVVVWALSKFFSDFWLLLIGSILYLSCCLFSNYYNAIESSSILKAYSIYSSQISDPYNSFPVAFLFVVLGKDLSEKKIFVSNIILLLLISISFLFLYCEYYFIQQFNLWWLLCFFSSVKSFFVYVYRSK